jgi:hypothetical protein
VRICRRAEAWLAVGMLALVACSSGRAKSALGRGQPTAASSSVPAATATLPISTTTTVSAPRVASTTTSTLTLAVAPAAALTAGQWSPIGLIVNGVPTLTATVLQVGMGGPLAGVVRISGALTRLVLYAGTAEPGGTWPNQGAVAPAQRAGLVAAFNSGFHTVAEPSARITREATPGLLVDGGANMSGAQTPTSWCRRTRTPSVGPSGRSSTTTSSPAPRS